MRAVKYPAIAFLIILFFISCGKIEKLPPEPSITFRSFELFDSTDILGNIEKGGRLIFYFQDGDGDFGLPAPEDGSGMDTTNLFFTLFRKTGGIFVQAADNDPLKPSPYRIPSMDRQGQDKTLRGTICVTFLYLFYSPTDTLMYKFYVKDRAEHASDTASTCAIVFSKNGICTN
jgi:hypothetical protein